MQAFKVTLKDGSNYTLTAAKIQADWPTVRLLGADDELVAFWADGLVHSVVPASASSDGPPAPPPPAED